MSSGMYKVGTSGENDSEEGSGQSKKRVYILLGT